MGEQITVSPICSSRRELSWSATASSLAPASCSHISPLNDHSRCPPVCLLVQETRAISVRDNCTTNSASQIRLLREVFVECIRNH